MDFNYKSKVKINNKGYLEIISYVHEIDISLALEELDYCLDMNKNTPLECIESMIEEGYNLDFMYYDFNYKTMTRNNND
jgi:hypothetical protein|tara:strand:+ start:179 stop:415 length:237 start_codon:yes stop_codon:yes gene_type:complete